MTVYYKLYASSTAQRRRIHLMIIKRFILVTVKISLSLTGTILQKPCFYKKICVSAFFKSTAAVNKKRALSTSTLDLKLRKKLVKCYVWSIAFYGAETWTLRAVDQKHMESFEMWRCRRMEKISWTDHVRNEVVLLESQREEEYST